MSFTQAKAPVGQQAQSRVSEPVTPRVELALQLASLGYHVHPLHYVSNGRCSCGEPDCKAGKHPDGRLNPTGDRGATTDRQTIIQWWALNPDANIGISADKSGLFVIGPDCTGRQEDFSKRGLPRTTVIQSGSGNHHYYYRRPTGCPTTKINKSEDFDILAIGNVVAPGSVSDLGPYTLLTELMAVDELPEAPKWAVAMLVNEEKRRQQAAQLVPMTSTQDPPVRLSDGAMEWWTGKRQAANRSDTIWAIAKELARANAAPHTIAAALHERDVALHAQPKYAGRTDANVRFMETARKAIAAVLTEGKPATPADGNAPDPACAERVVELEAKVDRIQEALRTEREARKRIEETLSRQWAVIRNPELSATKKVVSMATLHILTAAAQDPNRVDDEGRIITYRAEVADAAGVKEDTVSRVNKTLIAEGFVTTDVETVMVDKIDHETGEIIRHPTKQWRSRLADEPHILMERLATFTPAEGTPRQGGAREPKRCPDHPGALIRITETCTECDRVIDTSLRAPSDTDGDYLIPDSPWPQVAAMDMPEETPVDSRTYMPQVAAMRAPQAPMPQDAAMERDISPSPQRSLYPGEIPGRRAH